MVCTLYFDIAVILKRRRKKPKLGEVMCPVLCLLFSIFIIMIPLKLNSIKSKRFGTDCFKMFHMWTLLRLWGPNIKVRWSIV